MYFDSFAELLAMGGHGPYVWGAYALTLVVLVGNIIHPVLARRRFFRVQRQALRREEARDQDE